jgi:uncharacterized protein YggU (UPF0235/DUF167 family)
VSEPVARLVVRVTPRGGADRIDGWTTDADGAPVLKVRVRAAPTDGSANEAVVGLLAQTLGVPRSRIDLVRGAASRVKFFRISGLSHDDVLQLIED